MSTPTPLADDFPDIDPGFHHVLGSMPGVAYVDGGVVTDRFRAMADEVLARRAALPRRMLR